MTSMASAENTAAEYAIKEHALTLNQAAALMEFDGNEDAAAALIEVRDAPPMV